MSTSRSCNSSRAQYSARANASIWPSAVPKPSASDALLVTDADVEAVGGGLPAAAPTSGGGGPLSQGEIKIIQRALRASTADGEKQPLSRAAVEVGLTLLHVERLDPSEGTFAADFKLHCRWRDRAFEADADMASLRWKGAFANGVVAAHHRPGEAWPECVVKPLDPELVDRSRPRVDVLNAIEDAYAVDDSLRCFLSPNDAAGVVRSTERFRGTFRSPMSLVGTRAPLLPPTPFFSSLPQPPSLFHSLLLPSVAPFHHTVLNERRVERMLHAGFLPLRRARPRPCSPSLEDERRRAPTRAARR